MNSSRIQQQQNYASILWKVISEEIGEKACQDQIAYLSKAQRPRSLNVKTWISRIQNINALLPRMSKKDSILTKKKLTNEIIIPNILSQYLKEFRFHYDEAGSHHGLARKYTDIITENEERGNRRDKRIEHN